MFSTKCLITSEAQETLGSNQGPDDSRILPGIDGYDGCLCDVSIDVFGDGVNSLLLGQVVLDVVDEQVAITMGQEFVYSDQDPVIIDMGFLITTLIFVVVGIIVCLCTRICCNRGPSANLFHLTLVITATICCWMMWAIVYMAQMKPLIVPILNEGE
ncbi:hypothetical protein Lal_00017040 [Lupinus albus]|nr:hypothetical protein Lal_00017040 [Lupinus albus]